MQEERKKLIIKHQVTDDDGNRILIKGGGIKLANPEDFSDDFNELMKQKTEVDVHQIDFALLEKMKDREGKKVIPTPAEFEGLILLQIIKEEKEDEEGDE